MRKITITLCFMLYVSIIISMDISTPSQEHSTLMTAFSLHCLELAEQTINESPHVLQEYKITKRFGDTLYESYFAPIHELVIADNLKGVECLLKHSHNSKAMANAATIDYAYTPLNFARSKAMMNLLYKQGAEINAKNKQGDTIPYTALFAKNPPRWKLAHFLLKENRCDINAPIDNYGNTLLHKAVMFGCKDVVHFLLNRGAKPGVGNLQCISPAQVAMDRGYSGIVDLLNDVLSCRAFLKDDNQNTLLHYAVINRDAERIRWLLYSDIDLMAKNNQGLTAFDLAVQSGDQDVLEYFKKIFADVFVFTETYEPAYKNRKNFLLNNFGINTTINEGNSLLMIAASANLYDKCLMLLEHGANVNAEDRQGMSPLLLVLVDKPSLFSLFLNHGAIVSQKMTTFTFLPHYIYSALMDKYRQQNNLNK